jgi:DNA-directed RNA polymerase subunit RPC12/RpoP
MDDERARGIDQAYDELRRGGLRFCTRCGAEVQPYSPNESLGHDDYRDYDTPLADAELRQPTDSAYHCPRCAARWYALGWQDTGMVQACGHFLPVYVKFCAACGRPTRS